MYRTITVAALLVLANVSALGQTETLVSKPLKTFSGCVGVQTHAMYGDAQNVVPILPSVLPRLGYKWRGKKYVAPHKKNLPITSGVLTAPKHGTLTLYDHENQLYWYEAEPEFVGHDMAVLWVQIGDQLFNLRLKLDVVLNTDYYEFCGRTTSGEVHP